MRSGIAATRSLLIFTAFSVLAQNQLAQNQEVTARTVVFVCEHGSAKSVIAAAHFNHLASERGLEYRAIARGIVPDEKVAQKIREGLAADGLEVDTSKPKKITDEDVRRAKRVVTLGCELPVSKSAAAGKLSEWNGMPSVSENYGVARQDIVRRVSELIESLDKGRSGSDGIIRNEHQ